MSKINAEMSAECIVAAFNDLVDRVAALEKRTPEKRVRYRVMIWSLPLRVSNVLIVFDAEDDATKMVALLTSAGVTGLSVRAEPC